MDLVKYECSCCGHNLKFDGSEKSVTCESCGTTFLIINNLEKANDPNKKEADDLLKIFATRDMLLKQQKELQSKKYDDYGTDLSDILHDLNFTNKTIRNYGYYTSYSFSRGQETEPRISYADSSAYIELDAGTYGISSRDYLKNIKASSELFANGNNPYQFFLNEWAKENNYDELKKQSDDLGLEKDKIGKVLDRTLIKAGKKYTELDNEYGKLADAKKEIDYVLDCYNTVKELADSYNNLTNEQKEDIYKYFALSEQLIAVNKVIKEMSEIVQEGLYIVHSNNIYDINFDLMVDASKVERYHELKGIVYQMFESYGLPSPNKDKNKDNDRQIA